MYALETDISHLQKLAAAFHSQKIEISFLEAAKVIRKDAGGGA